jgi:hypothetical protein
MCLNASPLWPKVSPTLNKFPLVFMNNWFVALQVSSYVSFHERINIKYFHKLFRYLKRVDD